MSCSVHVSISEGGREGGEREQTWGGREEAMMLCRQTLRQRQWRKGGLREGGLMKGTSEEGTGRGMDGGREEASGGGIARGKGGARL